MFKILLLGRSNVGKTTILNKLCGTKNIALNELGTTRDISSHVANFFDMELRIFDSAGIEEKLQDTLSVKMRNAITNMIKNVDLCLLILDGKNGFVEADLKIYEMILRSKINNLIIINKSENFNILEQNIENDVTGIIKRAKNYLCISAEHKIGFDGLYQEINKHYIEYHKINDNIEEANKAIKLAIIGRPNAGKSTILNKLLKQERAIVHDQAGTTRDSISEKIVYNNQVIEIIDTAGIRKKQNISEEVENLSVNMTWNSVNFAHVCLLVMDVTNALEVQDLSIGNKVLEEGRSLILIFNKWDKIPHEKRDVLIEKLIEAIDNSFSGVNGMIFFTMSALMDFNISEILDKVLYLYKKSDTFLDPKLVNDWFQDIRINMKMPVILNKKLIFKHVKQTKVKPITFEFKVNVDYNKIPINFAKQLNKHLIDHFNFHGLVVRMKFVS